MTVRRSAAAALAAALLVAGCGGGGESAATASAPQSFTLLPQSAALPPTAARTPSGPALMDWAQSQFVTLFPGPKPTLQTDTFTYRYYPETGHYLGVAGNQVYAMGPVTGGKLQPVGNVADFACAVYPVDCGAGGGNTGVSISSISPSSLTRQVTRGSSVGDVSFTGFAAGNLQALANQTLYVLLEDPAGFFQPTPVSVLSSTTSITATFRGRALTTSGRFTGRMNVFACLDAACTRRLDNVPYAIAYDVTVAP